MKNQDSNEARPGRDMGFLPNALFAVVGAVLTYALATLDGTSVSPEVKNTTLLGLGAFTGLILAPLAKRDLAGAAISVGLGGILYLGQYLLSPEVSLRDISLHAAGASLFSALGILGSRLCNGTKSEEKGNVFE